MTVSSRKCAAQKFAVSTNLVEWANFATANLDASLSVSQHISLFVGGRYNPWEFRTAKGMQVYEKQKTAYAGFRYWPWYVYSGWWVGGKLRYSDFSYTGVIRPKLAEGKSVGAAVNFGYTWMIHERFNIEVGGGIWGGRHLDYAMYMTPENMLVKSEGPRNFVFIDDLSVSLMYVF